MARVRFNGAPQPITLFESPPGSGGNDGAMPTSYNFNWQFFTNLTTSQIAWFRAQPDWAAFVTQVNANPAGTAIPTVMDNPLSAAPPVKVSI